MKMPDTKAYDRAIAIGDALLALALALLLAYLLL